MYDEMLMLAVCIDVLAVDALGLVGQLIDKMFKNPPAKDEAADKNLSGYSSRADKADPDDWMSAA